MAQVATTDVDFDSERTAFQTTADEFVRRAVVPKLDRARAEMICPRELFDDAADAGLLGVLAPEDVGGGGLTDPRFGELVLAAATAAGATGVALALGIQTNVAVPVIASRYHGADRNDLIAALADGTTLVAVAGHTGGVSASVNGSGMQLSGTARCVINAVNADRYLVVVDAGGVGLRTVIVDAARVETVPPADALGARDAGSRDVVFDGVQVESERALSGEGPAAEELLVTYALTLSAVAIAGARAAIVGTVGYVQERKVFGRPLAEFENTRSVLRGVWAELLVAASYHDDCARRVGDREVSVAQAAAALERSSAIFDKAVDQGIQLHGGYGYMLEYPIAQAFADARFVALIAGVMPVLQAALLTDLGL